MGETGGGEAPFLLNCSFRRAAALRCDLPALRAANVSNPEVLRREGERGNARRSCQTFLVVLSMFKHLPTLN